MSPCTELTIVVACLDLNPNCFLISRLYDDGGLTLLLPYILKTRAKFAKCQLRVFFLANKINALDEEARNMAALLVTILPSLNKTCFKQVLSLENRTVYLKH